MNTLANVLPEVIDHLRTTRKLAHNTIRGYDADCRIYCVFLASIGISSWSDVTADHCAQFLAAQQASGASGSTLNRRVSAMLAMHTFLHTHGITATNPAHGIRTVPLRINIPRPARLDEIDRLVAHCRASGEQGIRDAAMIEATYSSGMRASELCSMNLADLEHDFSACRIIGKGNRERLALFGERAAGYLREWITELRPRFVTEGSGDAVWLSLRGGDRLSTRRWRMTMAERCRECGLPRINPHRLRHSCASHMYENGSDVFAIRDLLGHADISTTLIYTRVTARHVRDAQRKFHPRG